MWVMKGVLTGIVFFIVGWITYLGIRFSVAMYRLAQMVKAGYRAPAQRFLVYHPWSEYIYNPVLWITLLTAIAIGLWIVRTRTTHTV